MQPTKFKKSCMLSAPLLFAFLFFNCSPDTDFYEYLIEGQEEKLENIITKDSTKNDLVPGENSPEQNTNTIHPIDGAFYVTPNGSNNNNGLSESTPWNLSYAVSKATAGDVFYVKAGLYEKLNLEFNNLGTADNPIRFIGYKNTPGDINANSQDLKDKETKGPRGRTLLSNGRIFDYKQAPSPEEMPMLKKDYSIDDIAIKITGDFVELENFIISGYSTGVHIKEDSNHTKIWNFIFHEQGNQKVAYADSSHPDRYKGTGIINRGGQNTNIQFSTFLNVEQNALIFEGAQNGIVSNNIVYSYNMVNGTDYMFLITKKDNTPSKNLIFEYNKCERVPGVPHGGHGFIVKNGGENNTFRYWEVVHTNVEVNFTNSNNNLFEKGTLKGGKYDYGDSLTYILVTNGAHNNTFKDIIVDGAWGAIVMHDYSDGASNNPNIDAETSGVENTFINIIGKNCTYGIIFSEYGQKSLGGALKNKFVNCTFYNVEYGIRSYMKNSGNSFYNTSFNTTKGMITNHSHRLNSNTVFENCHLNGMAKLDDISSYLGKNNISGNPKFKNANNVNGFNVSGLELSDESPLINAGKNVSNITDKGNKDFIGRKRTNFNIGAF